MWYGYGWWFWWVAFVIIFFLLPVGYGWGYRGWGPWYRRRVPLGEQRFESTRSGYVGDENATGDWGGLAAVIWVVLIIAIIWLFFGVAWAWAW